MAQTMKSQSDIKEFVVRVVSGYKGKGEALIDVLQRLQRELSYLPEAAIHEVAYRLSQSSSEVYGVATFYNYFRLTPVGANLVSVCRGTACHVMGGPKVLKAVIDALDIQEGQSTADLKFSLDTVACIGACAQAPNIVINSQVYGRMTAIKARGLLKDLAAGRTIDQGDMCGRSC